MLLPIYNASIFMTHWLDTSSNFCYNVGHHTSHQHLLQRTSNFNITTWKGWQKLLWSSSNLSLPPILNKKFNLLKKIPEMIWRHTVNAAGQYVIFWPAAHCTKKGKMVKLLLFSWRRSAAARKAIRIGGQNSRVPFQNSTFFKDLRI